MDSHIDHNSGYFLPFYLCLPVFICGSITRLLKVQNYCSSFPGLSQIVDSDASVKAKLGEEQGVIVADVHLDPDRKSRAKPRCYGKMWALPMPWFAFIWPDTQKEGEESYALNQRRKKRALDVSSAPGL
jgi:hypothetical protein